MPLVKVVRKTDSGLVATTLDNQKIPVVSFGTGKAKINISEADRAKYPDLEALKRAALARFAREVRGTKGDVNHYYLVAGVRVKFDRSNYADSVWIDHQIYSPRKVT